MTPEPKPGLMRISPYVGGKATVAGANRIVKLSSNENPHGASPRAVEAFRAAGDTLALYPDGGAVALRAAIAKSEDLDVDRIMIGSGSDEILSLLCLAYAGPGDEVLHSAHGFLMYAISAKAVGADPVAAPETDLHADVDALLEAANERTKLVFLANPNNPTGTIIPDSEIRRLREGLPEQALLVIDAAYAEYVERADYDPGSALVNERDDVIMTRTFSKIHGLAAVRLGWCYGPPAVIDALHRARGPFNTNAPAQAAGTAAIEDAEFVKMTREDNAKQRSRVTGALDALGLKVTPSEGNFILVEVGEHGPRSAALTDEFLLLRGILVRRMEGYGLPGHLRISIGTAEENTLLIDAMRDFNA
jgi:histidinol-phosphate aminotransferase